MTAKVLIVDDEVLNQTTLESFLSADGYTLLFASNGAEGCAVAREEHPDLILLDVMMPDMDGFEVCRRLRADPELSRIPIIIITALDDERSRLEALRGGADDFLTKPCRREELRARVRTVVSLNRFRAIAEQKQRFQQLFEVSPSAIVLADAAGQILQANAEAEARLGAGAASTLVGQSILGRFDPSGAERVQQVLTDALNGNASEPREVRRATLRGERILSVRGAAVPEGDARLALLVFEDVTDEVQARETLRDVNTRLEFLVQERTRDLEEANGLLMSYASFVSHDLRSPLTVVKGYLSMLREGVVPVTTDALPLVSHAYTATLTMQEMIENILQLARDEHQGVRGEPMPALQPRPLVARVWTQVNQLQPNPNRRFVLGTLPAVGVSPVVVERVFYNLLGNALKYSAQTESPLIEVGAVEGAAEPTLFVRDNGVGFDRRDAEKLFREFARLDTAAATEGFGLGLSLVARLVRAYGGDIWAEGSVGKGATFFVKFPAPVSAQPERLALAPNAVG